MAEKGPEDKDVLAAMAKAPTQILAYLFVEQGHHRFIHVVLQVKKAAAEGYTEQKPTAKKGAGKGRGGKGKNKGKGKGKAEPSGPGVEPSDAAAAPEVTDKKREAAAAVEQEPEVKIRKKANETGEGVGAVNEKKEDKEEDQEKPKDEGKKEPEKPGEGNEGGDDVLDGDEPGKGQKTKSRGRPQMSVSELKAAWKDQDCLLYCCCFGCALSTRASSNARYGEI